MHCQSVTLIGILCRRQNIKDDLLFNNTVCRVLLCLTGKAAFYFRIQSAVWYTLIKLISRTECKICVQLKTVTRNLTKKLPIYSNLYI
jgi:hypothetical protein